MIAIGFIYSPKEVQAGIFSFVSELFAGEEEVVEEAVTHNSQNMPLLRASHTPDAGSLTGGGDITIVSDSALLAENNYIGGISENTENKPISDQIGIYVVREGDSLSEIAEMFGVSINTIRWSNDISGSTISPGQTLIILPVSGVRHTVKSGDTIASIAKKYKGNIEEIKSYNHINEDTKLSVGSVVIVPDGEIVPASSSSASRTKLVGANKEYSGYYMKPVSGTKTQGIHGYNGVDIAAPEGTSIVAAAGGRVLISRNSGWNGGYGKYIVIEHDNGTQTLYSHLVDTIVSAGTTVAQGQVIGYVGSTGKSTGPHLHFEVRGAKNPF